MTHETEIINKPTRSLFSALVQCRCPHCRQGRLFPYGTYSTNFYKMNNECPVCGQDFIIEPGFYYGSMYISYALTVAVEVAVILVLYQLFNDPDIWVYIVAMTVALMILSPMVFRLSRSLLLTYFGSVKYDPKAG